MRHPTYIIENYFYKLGHKIGSYPKRIIFIILIISGLASIGLIRFEEANNVRTEYSPLNAPSKMEYLIAKQFLKQNGTLDPCYIMTQARDGGSLLRDEYRHLVYNLTKSLQTEVVVYKNRRRFAFNDLCEPYCELNTAFLAFMRLYDSKNPNTFTYPSIDLFGTKAFIGNNVYGIKLKNKTAEVRNSSSTITEEMNILETDIQIKELDSFTTAVMPFYLVADYEDTDVIIEWQHAAIRLFENQQYSTLLKTGMTGDNLVSYEVRRMGIETAPLIFGSIVLMIFFVVSTSFRVNSIESKPWESFIGCLIPLLAMSTALGLMSGFGMKFQSIIVAAIFLVLSVGVDDIFIIIRAWHRARPLASNIPERMASALEDAGPSITISSLTNVMSFGIGALTDTPAVRSFCIFSAIAITICYIYQLVLLTAIIAVFSGARERRGYQSVLCCVKVNNQQSHNKIMEIGEKVHEKCVNYWATAVTKWSTRLFLGILMCLYFYISWIGICKLQSNISIDKMALPDSYLQDFQNSFEGALRNMQPISIFVLNPGDLRKPEQLKRIKSLVWDFEHSLNAYGSESTFFWIPQYEDFLRFYVGSADDDEEIVGDGSSTTSSNTIFSYTEIPAFFKSATYFYLNSFVHLNESACIINQPECIGAFLFITNFHDVIKYHELIPTVNDWRRLSNKYSDLQVYTYSDHTPFVDQTMSIDQTVFGSVAAALICTAIICLLFIPHLLSVIAAVFSVFSISLGIFGLLSLWSVDLDPLSMAALIMAIGFSVDFTAHISYHYYKASKGGARRRMETALRQIGWPMIQVGLSTIIALMPLLFKQSYLAMVFLKTIIVVVLLGMFHGLVLLPAILTMITRENGNRYSCFGISFGSERQWPIMKKKFSKGVTSNSSSNSNSDISSQTQETNSRGGSSNSSSSTSDISSERSSQSSTNCKERFYKNQHLIKSLNKESGWLNRNKSTFFNFSTNSNSKKFAPRTNFNDFTNNNKNIRLKNGIKRLSITDFRINSINIGDVDGDNNGKISGSTAFVHKITLGRSNSNTF